jgi:glutaredoxin-like protein NrdH
MDFDHVDGEDKGAVRLFALSTCIWCRKTKTLLGELGVAYDYVFVDQLSGEARDQTMTEVEKWNPRCSFPTLVVGNRCIIGFKEAEIREALGL